MLARSLAKWQIYVYMRKFYKNGHFLGHRGVYRCKFGVNWCILLCLHYIMMQLTFFVLQVVCFLSFCSHCCYSYMVVKASGYLSKKRQKTQKLTPKYTINWPLAKKLRASVYFKAAKSFASCALEPLSVSFEITSLASPAFPSTSIV